MLKIYSYSIQHDNRKITPLLHPRFIDTIQKKQYQQVNIKKHLYTMLLSCWKYIPSQFNKSTAKSHHPFSKDSLIQYKVCQINKSTEKKSLYTFLLNDWIFFTQFNKSTAKSHHPFFQWWINSRQNMPYQQVNREKNPIYFFLSCWKLISAQFNKSAAKLHYPFSQGS